MEINWNWRYRYYKKYFWIYFHFYFSKLINRKHWEADIGGTKIKLGWEYPYHHHYAWLEAHGKYEAMIHKWKEEAKTAETIIDAGSYNGLYGLVAAAVNPKARILLFEIDSINNKQIEENIKLNGFKNIILIPKALNDKKGIVNFKEHKGASGGKIGEGNSIVESTTLDEWLGSNNLIKFDIYGKEYDVIMSSKLLPKAQVKIFCEFYPTNKENLFWEHLKSIGYSIKYLSTRNDGGSKYYYIFN